VCAKALWADAPAQPKGGEAAAGHGDAGNGGSGRGVLVLATSAAKASLADNDDGVPLLPLLLRAVLPYARTAMTEREQEREREMRETKNGKIPFFLIWGHSTTPNR
jgi:hypothetical protein